MHAPAHPSWTPMHQLPSQCWAPPNQQHRVLEVTSNERLTRCKKQKTQKRPSRITQPKPTTPAREREARRRPATSTRQTTCFKSVAVGSSSHSLYRERSRVAEAPILVRTPLTLGGRRHRSQRKTLPPPRPRRTRTPLPPGPQRIKPTRSSSLQMRTGLASGGRVRLSA